MRRRQMRVAVLGVEEPVGAAVVTKLAEEGVEVLALERAVGVRGLGAVSGLRREIWRGGVGVLSQLLEGQDAVVICGGVERALLSSGEAIAGAVGELREVMEAMSRVGVARGVLVSSVATLGEGEGAREEISRRLPGSSRWPWVEAMVAREAEVYGAMLYRGVGMVVMLPSVLVGPRALLGEGAGFDWLMSMRGLSMLGGRALSVVDVRDVASGVWQGLRAGRAGRRYILGGWNVELRQIWEGLGEEGGGLSWPGVGELREVMSSPGLWGWVSSERAQGELSWGARSLEESMRDWRG